MAKEINIFQSRSFVAKLLNVSVAMVDKHLQEGHFAKDDKGKIDLRSVIEHYKSKVKEPQANEGATDWQNEYRRIKAQLAAIDLSFAEGRYLEKEQVLTDVSRAGLQLKELVSDVIKTLPDRVAGLDQAKCSLIIESELTSILEKFSKALDESTTDTKPNS